MKRVILQGLAGIAVALSPEIANSLGVQPKRTKTHRDKGYVKTVADYERIQEAEDRRARRAVKRVDDNNTCIAFNPCYKRNHR
jgi:hypothetical protein